MDGSAFLAGLVEDDAFKEALAINKPNIADGDVAETRLESLPDEQSIAEPGAQAIAEPDAQAMAEPGAQAIAEPEPTAMAEPDAQAIAEPDANAKAVPDAQAAPRTPTAAGSSTDALGQARTPSCVKCRLEIDLEKGKYQIMTTRVDSEGVAEATLKCNLCNNREGTVRRAFGSWPPASFSYLDESEQADFWKDPNTASAKTVEAAVRKHICGKKITEDAQQYGGTYQPIGVLGALGHDVETIQAQCTDWWEDETQLWLGRQYRIKALTLSSSERYRREEELFQGIKSELAKKKHSTQSRSANVEAPKDEAGKDEAAEGEAVDGMEAESKESDNEAKEDSNSQSSSSSASTSSSSSHRKKKKGKKTTKKKNNKKGDKAKAKEAKAKASKEKAAKAAEAKRKATAEKERNAAQRASEMEKKKQEKAQRLEKRKHDAHEQLAAKKRKAEETKILALMGPAKTMSTMSSALKSLKSSHVLLRHPSRMLHWRSTR